MNVLSDWKIVTALVSLFVLLWLGAFFVRLIEIRGAEVFRYESPFQDMTTQRAVIWLLTLISSGIDNGIYPVQLSAQVIVIVEQVLVIVGVPAYVLVMIWQTFSRILSLRTGMPPRLFVDHVVIVGWDPDVQDLIGDLLRRNGLLRFVIVADIPYNPLSVSPLPPNRVAFIHGSPVEETTMRDSRMDVARCIVVLERTENRERQLMRCPGFVVAFCRKFHAFCLREEVGSYPKVIVHGGRDDHSSLLRSLGFPTVRSKLAHDQFVPILFEQGAGVFRFLSETWSAVSDEDFRDNGLGIIAIQASEPQFWSASKRLGIAWEKDEYGRNPLEYFFTTPDTGCLFERYCRLRDALAARQVLLLGISAKCCFPEESNEERYIHMVHPVPSDIDGQERCVTEIREVTLYCMDTKEGL